MMNMIETLESRTLLSVTLDPIAASAFPGGKSVFVPITGTTDSPSRVSYSVSSDNGNVSARALANLTFLRMNISIAGVSKGYMEFALFNELAPNTVGRITSLVNSGFYNNLNFHRVIPGFMAQGGAASGVPNMDDEFNADSLFTTPGLLAMANANYADLQQGEIVNDTNSSQFFITVDETRWLDFRHTIFGQLLHGQDVLDQIMAVGTSSGTPTADVRITSASMVENRADTVLLVKGPAGSSANINVTAQDQNSTSARSFAATSYVDTQNSPPFLNGIADQQTTSDLPVSFAVSVTDIDSPPGNVLAGSYNISQLQVSMAGSTVTVTPVNGFSGTGEILVYLPQGSGLYDSQRITVTVLAGPFATYDAGTRRLNVNATSGNDTLTFSQSGNTFTATLNGKSYDFGAAEIAAVNVMLYDGNDVMNVPAGIAIPFAVQAGSGNDSLFGGDGNDTFFGGDGDDTLHGAMGADYLDGQTGHDLIGGQSGWDTILGAAGRDTLRGGDNGDVIRGGGGMDLILGGKGLDTLVGAGGNDTLDGQEGADWIYGGEHDDVITGGTKLDHIYGEGGNDTIFAIDGEADTVSGGDGNDTVHRDLLDIVTDSETLLNA